MSTKTPKTRDELALGVLNPKTNKRKGGYIEMYRSMRQWQDWLTSGERGEDDLIEAAYAKADETIAKRNAAPDEEPRTYTQEDAEYRDAQEARYREEYDWDNATANDEAALQHLLDLEVQSRVVNREFSRAHMPVKERTDLLSELRNIAKDHAELQKRLGIDRPTRDSRKRSEDPMQSLREQIESGAARMRELIEEAPAAFATCNTEEELQAMAKHHLGFPYPIVGALLREHKRILGAQ